MNAVRDYFRELGQSAVRGWDRFWFTPADPATLGIIRLLAGAMLLYTHLVWTLELENFFGPQAWVSAEAAKDAPGMRYAWSYFWLIGSPGMLWTAHVAALIVFALLTVGLFSRVASVLAFVCAVSYVNRVPGALFGLDQVNCMLAMYLMVGPCGDAFSLDRWLARRRGGGQPLAAATPSTSANIAIRLIQVHMCVIYLFAGLSKLQGIHWWAGDAMWGAFANAEYQTLEMTWLASWPVALAFLTHVTVYWEVFFCVLVWPRLTRPLVLFVAIPLHLGIGICMGMMTFGLAMLVGCSSFLPPAVVRAVFGRSPRPVATTEQGRAGDSAPSGRALHVSGARH